MMTERQGMAEASEPGEEPRWAGSARWYLWDGGFLAVGRGAGIVPEHSHHALQVVIGLDGETRLRDGDGQWQAGRGLIVRADAPHSFDQRGALGAMIFVDPESSEGAWLGSNLMRDVTVVPESRLVSCIAELRRFHEQPLEAMEIGALIRHSVHALCAGAPPSRRIDERVTAVLTAIREADDLRMSLEAAAAMVFLSPSRFAHLFTQQVGLPFRRYMLWRKLARAVVAIGRERTIAAAAHAADFADAAHLTRTFYQMFGIPPSVMMRGDFFAIRSPFAFPAVPPAART
jgi:AraC-like DNA-binding protein